MGEIDFRRIGAECLTHAESLLACWFPAGYLEGKRQFKVGGVDGAAGESLVVEIAGRKAGLWKDFASGEKGSDLISLYAAAKRVPMGEAAKALGDLLRLGPPPKPATINRRPGRTDEDEDERPEAIMPVPADAPAPRFRAREEWGRENGRWPYHDQDGRLLFWAVRHDQRDGGKGLRPHTYCRHADGSTRWRWRWPARPIPLYGLPRLRERPGACVLVVEGEKKADAGARLLPALPVLGWPGGVERAISGDLDLSPLAGRKVLLWPDADRHAFKAGNENAGKEMPRELQPGWRAMVALAAQLKGVAAGVRIVVPPTDRKDGWDLADAEDEGWTQDSTDSWLRSHLLDPEAAPAPDRQPEPEQDGPVPQDPGEPEPVDMGDGMPVEDEEPPPAEPPTEDLEPTTLPEHPHFKALGHNDSRYFYLSKSTRQIVSLTGPGHQKLALLQLAPLIYWEREYAGEKGVRWESAADACMRACGEVGIWDPARIRGRGCWWDRDRLVVHLGDRLLVDGEQMPTTSIPSGYVYEAAARMHGPGRAALSASEARRIVEIAKGFAWEVPASAALLCGWIALAPVCGALAWRPHVWLTGGSGSGKTTVLERFLAPLCAGTEIRVQGSSTEAGIRQTLRADARPVIFDESESNDERERARIQAILALIRQSSSESGAQTFKGTAGGSAMSFHIRSMFCLASINVTIKQQADHTRIAVLSLRSGSASGDAEARAAQWRALEAQLDELANDRELPGRLLARIVSLIPVLRKNIKTFIRVSARHFKSQRLGDQYGTLLAGCYALWSDGEASEAQAQALIDRFAWETYTEDAEDDESAAALSSILQSQVRVDGLHGGQTATLGELVATVRGEASRFDPSQSALVLGRHGLRIRDGALLVANRCEALGRLLRERPWGHGWNNYLRRLPGASTERPTQFSPGHLSRCTSIPLELVLSAGAEPNAGTDA